MLVGAAKPGPRGGVLGARVAKTGLNRPSAGFYRYMIDIIIINRVVIQLSKHPLQTSLSTDRATKVPPEGLIACVMAAESLRASGPAVVGA